MSSDSLVGTHASVEVAPGTGQDAAPPSERTARSREPIERTCRSRGDSGGGARAGTPVLARPRVLDTVIALAYLLAAIGLYRDLWAHLDDGYLIESGEDQNLFEWFFAVAAHGPALFTTLQNFP